MGTSPRRYGEWGAGQGRKNAGGARWARGAGRPGVRSLAGLYVLMPQLQLLTDAQLTAAFASLDSLAHEPGH